MMYKQIVRDVFVDVLSKMTFLFAEPLEGQMDNSGLERGLMASMCFSGEINGSVELALPHELCLEVAAGILGEEPQSPKAQERSCDAVLELLNVICGQLVTAIAGDQPRTMLSTPVATTRSPEQLTALAADTHTLAFLIEERCALVRLVIEEIRR